jgi:hypothetical protein
MSYGRGIVERETVRDEEARNAGAYVAACHSWVTWRR